MTNGDNGGQLASEILRTVAREHVKFENGFIEFRMGLTADGKIEGIGFRRL